MTYEKKLFQHSKDALCYFLYSFFLSFENVSPAMMQRIQFHAVSFHTCYLQYDTMSEAFSNTFAVLAMEHHDLQKCTWQNQGGPGCKEENPAPHWLLTTIWHKQQNRGRCELKEENLAPLRLQLAFSQYFYCLVRLRYEFTPGKVKPR